MNYTSRFRIHRSLQKGTLTEVIDVPDEDVGDIVEALQYFGFNLDNKVWLLQPGKSLQTCSHALSIFNYTRVVPNAIYSWSYITMFQTGHTLHPTQLKAVDWARPLASDAVSLVTSRSIGFDGGLKKKKKRGIGKNKKLGGVNAAPAATDAAQQRQMEIFWNNETNNNDNRIGAYNNNTKPSKSSLQYSHSLFPYSLCSVLISRHSNHFKR